MTKIFKNTSRGYEFSGLRCICPEHDFQYETKIEVSARDIFGGAMHLVNKCKLCGKVCKEEVSTEYDDVTL